MKKGTKFWIYSMAIIIVTSVFTVGCKKEQNNTYSTNLVTDIDGNAYHFKTIGTQVWMVENLKVTKYRNGDPIPNVLDGTVWGTLSTGAYCDYDNSPNSTVYGKLYNWYAIHDSRNIAPTGWHVPSDDDWTRLINYLGGDSVAGGKLKEIGLTHWQSPNAGATDEKGFTALPGGSRIYGTFIGVNLSGNWGSTTESYSYSFALYRNINYDDINVHRYQGSKNNGLSVRCIRD